MFYKDIVTDKEQMHELQKTKIIVINIADILEAY